MGWTVVNHPEFLLDGRLEPVNIISEDRNIVHMYPEEAGQDRITLEEETRIILADLEPNGG